MSTPTHNPIPSGASHQSHFDLFAPLRRWMNSIEVKNEKFARFLCGFIPSSCPFERDITLFGRTFHIPALCGINPLYQEVLGLRRRAADYLEERENRPLAPNSGENRPLTSNSGENRPLTSNSGGNRPLTPNSGGTKPYL